MSRRRHLALLGALIALAGPGVSGATMMREVTLPEMVARAERIIRGSCLDVRETTDPRSGLPVTEVTFAVAETLKGPATTRLVFRQLGGEGRPGLGPRFVAGEEAVLFLGRESASGLTAPIGLEQGKIPLVGASRAAVASSLARDLVTPCRGRRCLVDLDGFLGMVRIMVGR